MTRAFFRKLSLMAEQSWHQNSGAKRRAVISSLNMRLPEGLPARTRCRLASVLEGPIRCVNPAANLRLQCGARWARRNRQGGYALEQSAALPQIVTGS
jgi:hypothetical protein